jgi:short-subunit dehydrogenase
MNFRQLWRRNKKSIFKPVVLVTGCSSGIGLALARLLRDQTDYRLVITSRAGSLKTVLKEFADSDRIMVRPLDVTIESQRTRLIKEIEEKWTGVNILINNAGISYRAVVEHMSAPEELIQFEANYFGPLELIRAVLPHMRKIGRGKIINVSSVSGMLAMPTMGSYSASKYALEGLSEALWYETKPLGINVCLVQPGFVRSRSFLNVRYSFTSSNKEDTNGVYMDYYQHMTPFIERLMALSFTTPEDIAKQILKVIRTENPPLWVPATIDAKIFYYLRRFVHRKLLLNLLFAALPGANSWGRKYSKRRAS